MKKRNTKIKISLISLDFAKNVFQIHGIDESGQAVLKKSPRRIRLYKPGIYSK
jgi:hypothetical protein